jgi:hypothetical protein
MKLNELIEEEYNDTDIMDDVEEFNPLGNRRRDGLTEAHYNIIRRFAKVGLLITDDAICKLESYGDDYLKCMMCSILVDDDRMLGEDAPIITLADTIRTHSDIIHNPCPHRGVCI